MTQELFLVLSILFISFSSNEQTYNQLVKQASSSYDSKDYDKSLELYQAAFQLNQDEAK